jgi:SPX domain protein involved in polyphosphate accumulation
MSKLRLFIATTNTGRVHYCETSIETLLHQDADIPDRFDRVEEEMNRITSEVAELSSFIRLNYSGFVKV